MAAPRDPERLHRPGARGTYTIYVGMAAGVGKTTRALHELRERLERGEDALIGLLETHGRRGTQQAAEGLPMFPRLPVVRGGVTLGELDVDGLIARHPRVVLVDELAHTNAPGSPREKRWQDVDALLNAEIDVVSTVNVQHLESLNDTVARLTGVRVHERLPDTVLHDADELVFVDLPPEDLRARLREGHIYAPEKIEQSLSHFFTTANLTALREIALRQVADAVEMNPPAGQPGVRERVVVAVSAEERGGRLIRRGGLIASRLRGELHVVTVRPARLSAEEGRLLEAFRAITEALEGYFHVLENTGSVASTLVEFVRAVHATQVVMGETSRSRLTEFLRGDIIKTVLRETRNVDVHVISRD